MLPYDLYKNILLLIKSQTDIPSLHHVLQHADGQFCTSSK